MAGAMKLPILLVACWMPLAWAQSGADPTRPAIDPKIVVAEPEGTAPPAASGLQTIIRRKNAKPAAIINGEYVELGGRLGEARLSQVEDGFVVMTSPGGVKEMLTLTPGVEKKMIRPEEKTGMTPKKQKKPRSPARK